MPSLPVRLSFNQGAQLTSLVGYSLIYNTLDNNKNPTSGIRAEFKQELAGLGGDMNFFRNTGDVRFYHEVIPDYIGLIRLQAGNIQAWGGKQSALQRSVPGRSELRARLPPERLRPARPDLLHDARRDRRHEFLGGHAPNCRSRSISFQRMSASELRSLRMRVRSGVTRDRTRVPGETMTYVDSKLIRSSVGAGLVWDSPFGPLRFDYAIPLTKESYDIVQEFRFGGGTRF